MITIDTITRFCNRDYECLYKFNRCVTLKEKRKICQRKNNTILNYFLTNQNQNQFSGRSLTGTDDN